MKFDIKNILIFALAIGMTSCVETMKDGDMSTGYLGVPVLETDIQVEEFGATKAAPSLPRLSVPESSELHFKVTGSDNKVKWNQNGLWSTALQMPVGAYTIEVNYGSNTYRNPWYTGTCNGTISAVTEAVPAIGLRLCNSLLAVVLADDFTQHFTPSEGECVTISSTSGSITTTLGNYVFVPAEEALTIQVAGTSSAGISKTLSWTLKNPLSAATATYVTCSLKTNTTDAPTITMSEIPAADAWGNTAYVPLATTANISPENVANMQYFASSNDWTKSVEGTVVDIDGKKLVKFTDLTPGAIYKVRAQIGALKSNEVSMTMSTSALSIEKSTIAHTYTNDELDGTDFTASFSVAEKFGVTASSLQLCKTDGTPLRTVDLTGTSADWISDGSTLKGPRDWPYLSKGNYILKGTAIQNEVEVHLEEKSITVDDAPTFTVNTPSAHTSYDTYLASGAAAANNEDGATIYGIANNGVKISSNILNNDNYKSLIGGYTYFIDEKQVYEVNQANQTWGSHEIKAKYTFDEVTAESDPLTCHVTGLPYNSQTPTQTNWTGNANKWESSQVILSNQTIQIKFYTPENCNISIDYNLRIDRNTLGNTFYIYSNTSEVYKNAPAYNTDKTYNGTLNDVMLYSSNPVIMCKNDQNSASTSRVYINSIGVYYR